MRKFLDFMDLPSYTYMKWPLITSIFSTKNSKLSPGWTSQLICFKYFFKKDMGMMTTTDMGTMTTTDMGMMTIMGKLFHSESKCFKPRRIFYDI